METRKESDTAPARNVRPAEIPIVILAGGYGTRLMEETQLIPKPMVTIGGKPILLHIMRYYSSYGFRRFVICLGYKGHLIKEYFLDLAKHTASLVIDGSDGSSTYEDSDISEWKINLVETGEHSLTATRLRLVRGYLDAPHFGLTYGDGLCDVNLAGELSFHLGHGKLGTVTAVHYPARFGKLEIDDANTVRSFREKQTLSHDFINGGFFIFRREFLERLPEEENVPLEQEPLTRLAAEGELMAYPHDAFWMCMDTMRDREDLERVYSQGDAPWVRW